MKAKEVEKEEQKISTSLELEQNDFTKLFVKIIFHEIFREIDFTKIFH